MFTHQSRILYSRLFLEAVGRMMPVKPLGTSATRSSSWILLLCWLAAVAAQVVKNRPNPQRTCRGKGCRRELEHPSPSHEGGTTIVAPVVQNAAKPLSAAPRKVPFSVCPVVVRKNVQGRSAHQQRKHLAPTFYVARGLGVVVFAGSATKDNQFTEKEMPQNHQSLLTSHPSL